MMTSLTAVDRSTFLPKRRQEMFGRQYDDSRTCLHVQTGPYE